MVREDIIIRYIFIIDLGLECVCRDLELGSHGGRSQIIPIFYCCIDDLGFGARWPNLFSATDTHKSQMCFCICCSCDLWSTKSLIWVSRWTLTNILLLLQGRFGARMPESGPGYHGRRYQKCLLLLQGRFGAGLPESGPGFLGQRLQTFFFCCRGDLERVLLPSGPGFYRRRSQIFAANTAWSAVVGSRPKPPLKNILLLLQERSEAHLPKSGPSFHCRLSQIFFFCCRGDLMHIYQDPDIVVLAFAHKNSSFFLGWYGARFPTSKPRFLGLAHKYSSLFAGAIWSTFTGIWTKFSRPTLTKFFSFCSGDLERVCLNLDLVFTADAHKYSSLVAGAIWSAFAGIWTWVLEATLTNICCKYGMERDGRV